MIRKEFKYPDGSIGPADWFKNVDGGNISPQVLYVKPGESDPVWISRLWDLYGVRPVKRENPIYDPMIQDLGTVDETVDGEEYLVISYPNPVYKADCLDIARDRKRDAVIVENNTVRDGGIEVAGVVWDSDANARTAYQDFRDRLKGDPGYTTTTWRSTKYVVSTLDLSTMSAIDEVGEQILADLGEWVKVKYTEINTAYDAEDIEAINAVDTGYVAPGVDLTNK